MKENLRQRAKEIRKSISIITLSDRIKQNLFSIEEYKNSKNIFCYYSFSNEVVTTNYFEDNSKSWYIPKVTGEEMLVCPYSKDNMVKNKYGILEPSTPAIEDLSVIDLIIIPALSADKNGYRIGYGKGYYDRFLKKLKHNPTKIVLVFSDLFIDNVYPDVYDEKCDIVVTDKEIYRVL